MTNRRNILANFVAGAAALPAFAWSTLRTTLQASAQDKAPGDCPRPPGGPYADYFPNVVVYTHENQKALFYNDLLRGKRVMINCMSVKNEALYPATETLLKVQQMLGHRVGRDVFIYSMTVDPEHDTTQVLRAFAEKHGVKPGWLFLTGEPAIIHGLRGRLFPHVGGGSHHHGSGPSQDCSMGLIRYGNEAVGLWGSVPVKADPEWIVKRLSWVEARQRPAGPPKRRGPIMQVAAKSHSQNSGGL
jgi:protein SCO1/2